MNAKISLNIPPTHTWTGSELKIRTFGPDGKERVHSVKAGAAVVPLGVNERGLLVSFPPVPSLVTLEAKYERYIVPPKTSEPASSGSAELTPELLLQLLQHPQIVPMIQHLVATKPDQLKATAQPLIKPLISAFATPEYMPMINMALAQFGLN